MKLERAKAKPPAKNLPRIGFERDSQFLMGEDPVVKTELSEKVLKSIWMPPLARPAGSFFGSYAGG